MTDINTLDAINIESCVNADIAFGGKQARLFAKDIIVAENPINRFYESVCKNIGKNLKVLFITSPKFEDDAKNLKSRFEAGGFSSSEFLVQESRVELKTAQNIVYSLRDDARVLIAVGGGIIADLAKTVSFLCGLPLALYYAVPECDGALHNYSQAYHSGSKEIYETAYPWIVCADLDKICRCGQNYTGSGIGILASKYISLFDWHFAHIFCLEEFDYQISETAFKVLESFSAKSLDLLKNDKNAYLNLVQAQLKISALVNLSDTCALIGGGETGALNVLEMFFHKENRGLRLTGENLFLCSKIIMRAYKVWLNNIKTGYFMYSPDNTLRLEKLADYLGLGELDAINKILVLDDYEQWEIMQYKWIEYNKDLAEKINQYAQCFEKYEHIFKRIYDDAGFWTTKYLTDTDIMLMIGLAPDVIKTFTLLSFIKLTGLLDKYLEGV
ncbi:MAG TPA: iron-containing alcohol dehydrogenase [Clostridia bacterium]